MCGAPALSWGSLRRTRTQHTGWRTSSGMDGIGVGALVHAIGVLFLS